MARSTRSFCTAHFVLFAAFVTTVPLAACSSGPSKGDALAAIQRDVKQDGRCTLPVDVIGSMKVQHTSKGICVPRESTPQAQACLEALAAAGITHRMPDAYMAEWPDDVAAASLSAIPAYDRRARNLLFKSCFALAGGLREGGFPCADVQAESILKVTKDDDTHSDVRYSRKVALRPELESIERACGSVTRPPSESVVAFTKTSEGWKLADEGDGVSNADSGSAPARK